MRAPSSLLVGSASVAIVLFAASPAFAGYIEDKLVSDIPGEATFTDSDLVNAWGIAHSAGGPWWVANNGTATSTIYDGAGVKSALTVKTPPPSVAGAVSKPTGLVFNPSTGFVLPGGAKASFIFSGEDGTISAWNGGQGTNAVRKVDNPFYGTDESPIYKGLAIGNVGVNNYIYASDFHHGVVDVFDTSFAKVSLGGNFTDPTLPSGYAPFGIQNLDGNIYVSYALQDADAEDEIAGAGFGYVSVFDSNGNFIRRVASNGHLDAPWGITLAPADFGKFAGDLLVGNFGDGTINAYDAVTDAFKGQLHDANGLLMIEGLWGLGFGNNGSAGPTNSLYFSAGIEDEAHGLFGDIRVVPEPSSLAILGVGLLGLMGMRRRKAR